MTLLLNMNLTKCFQRFSPVVKYKNIINQTISFYKSGRSESTLTSIRRMSLSNHSTTLKLTGFGFSLFGWFGLDENIDPELKLINTIKIGLLHLQKDDYIAFEQTLHDALKIAYELQHFDGITYVFDILANGAFMKKDFVNAEKLFVTVMQRLMSKGGHENDLNMLHISLKVAKIYEAQKKFSLCEIGYEHCINHLDALYQKDPDNENVLGLFALSLDAYARYLLKQGQTKKALINFKKSYDMCVKLNGEVFEMNVILLNDLGTVSYAQGQVDEALNYLNKAVKIGQHLPDLENFSSVYVNLGNIYLEQGLLKEAEKNCVEGLKNAKRHHYEKGKKKAALCLEEIKNSL